MLAIEHMPTNRLAAIAIKTCVFYAFFLTGLLTPQCGHVRADVATSLPQVLQFASLVIRPPPALRSPAL